MSVIDQRNIVLPQTGLFVDGSFVRGASQFEVEFPGSGEIITKIDAADAKIVDRAVQAAHKAFHSSQWKSLDARGRGELLFNLANLIEDNSDQLARLETLDTGKPLWESQMVDIPNAVKYIRFYAGAALTIEGETLPVAPDFLNFTLREPLGVVAAIVPWNFPLVISTWKFAPAIAAGNTVVLKPAEQTPLSALRLAELTLEAGFPPGVFNVINGAGSLAGKALVEHPLVSKVSFTGSTQTGRFIGETCGRTFKKCTLELGGKSPVIVCSDADLDVAAEETFDGIFFNQGEVCSAGSRLIVDSAIKDDLLDRILSKTADRRVGDPFEDVDQGALISAAHRDKVSQLVNQGVGQGGRKLTGGHSLDRPGYYYAPTVVDNIDPANILGRLEVFGPVLAVQQFEGDALDLANDSVYGLAATVFTKDVSRAMYLARKLQAGVIWINCSQKFDAVSPFGGYKDSGLGRDLGRQALYDYTQTKSVWIKATL